MQRKRESSIGAVNRRRFLGGIGAAAAIGTTAAVIPASPAAGEPKLFPNAPAPKPIAFTTPREDPGPPDPFNEIHWALPGPTGATTQVLGLPAFGPDVDPSTIGDYEGFTAFAVVAGTATSGDGEEFGCEFDVRIMDGRYIAEDGRRRRGTFAFL